MGLKELIIRVDEDTAEELRVRAAIEKRSTNEIVSDAVREYTKTHPVSREDMLALVRAIANEDASVLNALADAERGL